MQIKDCTMDSKKALSLYLNKNLTIASGATPIGSANHALGELGEICIIYLLLHDQWQTPDNELDISIPSGEICD
jgi:hypothetical protein